MKPSDNKWRLMLVRAYEPLFASLFGTYVPKVYHMPLMVIYTNGWCFWYVPESYYKEHDKKILNMLVTHYNSPEAYKRYAKNVIKQYEVACKKIKELLSNYEKEKTTNKSKILEILGDTQDFITIDKKYFNADYVENLNTYLGLYGFIISFPRMSISGGIKEILQQELFNIYSENLGFQTYKDKMAFIDNLIGKLTFNDDETNSLFTHYEFDLLRTALHLKSEIIRDFIIYIAQKIPPPIVGDYEDYFYRIEYSIIRRISKNDYFSNEIKKYLSDKLDEYLDTSDNIENLIKKYSSLRSGWKFGKSLEKREIIHRLKSLFLINNIDDLYKIEVEWATKIMLFDTLKYNKKFAIKEIKKNCDEKALDKIIFLSNVLNYEGWMRYWRKMFTYEINYVSKKFMEDIAYWCNLGLEDIYFLTINEIVKILRNNKENITKEEIEKRKKFMLVIFNTDAKNPIDVLISGKENIENYIKKSNLKLIGGTPYDIDVNIDFPLNRENCPSISVRNFPEGRIIEGPVVKIDNEQDWVRVSWEDILVARMVEPYHGIVFKPPKAIIVEDLGTESHAVHVAISKGIPIVVGARGILSLLRRYKLIGEEKRTDKGLKISWKGEIDICNLWRDKK